MTQSTRRRSMLLFVCHDNLCHSPLAEALTRVALARVTPTSGTSASQTPTRRPRIDVLSAGTHTKVDEPMHPAAAEALAELEIDAEGFRSRELSEKHIIGAGLILTATRQERAHCATLSPAAVRRVFTIRQFGRLAAAIDPACLAGVHPSRRLGALVDEVVNVRGQLQPVPAAQDDLVDPLSGTAKDMYVCVNQIQQSLRPILALIDPS